jgi:UDP-N-acetylglucosamine 4,6-dehydratase
MIKPTASKRVFFFFFFDLLLSLSSLYLAYNLRFNFEIPPTYLQHFWFVWSLVVFFKLSTMSILHLYNVSWRFFSLVELKKIFYAHIIAYPLVVVIYYLSPDFFNPFPRSVLIIDLVLSMMFIGFFRILKRLILESDKHIDLKKTVIIGVGSFAQSIMKTGKYRVVAIFDNDNEFIGSYFANMKVQALQKLEEVVRLQNIQSVIIAKEFDTLQLNSFFEILSCNNIDDIQVVSLSNNKQALKELSIEDLLARYPKDLDKNAIQSFIKEKVVLITGAGGSIGSEISRQCAAFGAKQLILLDHSEYNLYAIAEILQGYKPVLVMQSVIDREAIDVVIARYAPQIVIHAAAYKHVPLVEENIAETVKNNVLGTKNVIDSAIAHHVEKIVLISTDKAVRPTNVMGATKRVCELYAQNVNADNTEIVTVRFGNVLGSSGSVIPKFRSQIEKGGPVTVTHPEVTRYFMLLSEACELVLQAASIGGGGEIFILDMGEPVKIVDLAHKMCELSGKENIEIIFTGLRAGEKLYEELLIEESDAKTQYESILVATSTLYPIEKLEQDIQELLTCNNKLVKLQEILPEFNHQKIS